MREKFYICRHCGNLIGLIHDAGVPMMCCGQKMEALVPNTTEADDFRGYDAPLAVIAYDISGSTLSVLT